MIMLPNNNELGDRQCRVSWAGYQYQVTVSVCTVLNLYQSYTYLYLYGLDNELMSSVVWRPVVTSRLWWANSFTLFIY